VGHGGLLFDDLYLGRREKERGLVVLEVAAAKLMVDDDDSYYCGSVCDHACGWSAER